jgi:dTDP-4-amino-4,6-dideoxygalactose transaminase
MKIPFNKSVYFEDQPATLIEVLKSGDTSGNGVFGKKCEKILKEMTGKNVRLVSSGSHALDMMPLLLSMGPGDEVILPSFTFSSTANAFALRGCTLRFADNDEYGNIKISEIERLITPKTKAVMVVHYAGASCDLDAALEICQRHNIPLLEDAAQAIGAGYKGRPLGTIGSLGCFSFHETKNISAGEGGAIILGDEAYLTRTEILREKGTNRSAFFQGLVDKYSWVDIGSSFVLSELNSAYLFPQLERFLTIQAKRESIWKRYQAELAEIFSTHNVRILETPVYNSPNYHMFAVIFPENSKRNKFLAWMKEAGVICPFHYIPLHSAPCGRTFYKGEPEKLEGADKISSCLVRFPLFFNLTEADQSFTIDRTKKFF